MAQDIIAECMKLKVAQWCLTLCNPMDNSLPGSSVHGILQEFYWSGQPFPSPGDLPNPGLVAIPFSRGQFQHRDRNQVFCIIGGYFTNFTNFLFLCIGPRKDHQESPRIPEQVAYSFSKGSSQPRNQTKVSCTAGGFFTS